MAGLFAASPEPLVLCDTSLRVLALSRGAEALFGYGASEGAGLPLVELLSRGSVERLHRAMSGLRTNAAEQAVAHGLVLYARRRGGACIAVEATIACIDGCNGPVHCLALRPPAGAPRARLAIAAAGLQVLDFDFEAHAMTVDGAPGRILSPGAAVAGLARRPWALVHPEDRARALAWWRRAIHGDTQAIELRAAVGPGPEVWALVAGAVVPGEGRRPRRLVLSILDITERKRVEARVLAACARADAASAAKSAYLANLSHEIRTPLNGVLGMVHAMGFGPLDPQQRERVDIIRSSGHSLLAIVNSVLDLAKIEAGRIELDNAAFDVVGLVWHIVEGYRDTALDKRLRLTFQGPQGEDWRWGDATRLRQIVGNLISNALKFTDCGEVMVVLETSPGAVRIEVRDTGAGMPPEVLSRLFTPFTQGDASTQGRFGGTGLGLSICQGLARLMGGDIAASSRPGLGSAFQVHLPMKPAKGAGYLASTAAPVSRVEGLRVLAADDNEVNRMVLKVLLEQIGAELRLVADGEAAVEAWAAERFDLVLMDVHMPKLDGVAAAREIRRREAERGLSRTPIIALTADAFEHQARAFLAAGMDQCVTKPVDPTRLYAAIAETVASDRPGG